MKDPIIILHGWGISGSKYKDLQEIFEQKGYKVFAPDFPGFGNTKLPKSQLNLDDYVNFLEDFYKRNNIKRAILIGHSFGGRVGVKYVSKHSKTVSKFIVTGSPLIKKPLPLAKKIISSVSNVGKKFVPQRFENAARKIVYQILGEWDYYKAGNLKNTLINVLKEDLSPILSTISVPTLILWGDKDTFVTLKVGREISEKISNASLSVIRNATHKLPYENPEAFTKEVLTFIQ